MRLSEIFEYLTTGELAQLHIGGMDPHAPWSQARAEDYQQLVAHVNVALKVLFSRFWIRSKEVIVDLYPHIQEYVLDRRYAETNNLSLEPYKYIADSIFDPFCNDVLKIEQVFNEGGELMFLNDINEPWSVFTPSFRSVQIPFPMICNSMVIHYRASHPTIRFLPSQKPDPNCAPCAQDISSLDGGEFDAINNNPEPPNITPPSFTEDDCDIVMDGGWYLDSGLVAEPYQVGAPTGVLGGSDFPGGVQPLPADQIEVMLPEWLLEPLLFYVASRAFASLNSDQNQEGNTYLQKYESSCQRLESTKGMFITANTTNERLDVAGWV